MKDLIVQAVTKTVVEIAVAAFAAGLILAAIAAGIIWMVL